MTLINCSENCHFQHEGYCKLNHSTAINSVRVNGCSYFKERGSLARKHKKKPTGGAPS